MPNGVYTLRSVVHETNGGIGHSAPITVTVVNSPLAASVLVPSTGATLHAGSVLDAGTTGTPPAIGVTFELTGGALTGTVVGTATPTIYGWIASMDTTGGTRRQLRAPERGHRRDGDGHQSRDHGDGGRQHRRPTLITDRLRRSVRPPEVTAEPGRRRGGADRESGGDDRARGGVGCSGRTPHTRIPSPVVAPLPRSGPHHRAGGTRRRAVGRRREP